MASPRVISVALRLAPLGTLAALALWTASDTLAVGGGRASLLIWESLAFGLVVLVVAAAFRWSWARPIGLAAVVVAYGSAHAFFLGVQVVPSLVFLVLVICFVELRILEARFAPIYEATLPPSDRRRIDSALGRAVLRLSIAAVLAIIIPMLAANLALAGVVPLTTIPSALALAGALVAIVLAIALLPGIKRVRS